MAQNLQKVATVVKKGQFLAVVEGVAYGPFRSDDAAFAWLCEEFPIATRQNRIQTVEFSPFVYVEVPGGRS